MADFIARHGVTQCPPGEAENALRLDGVVNGCPRAPRPFRPGAEAAKILESMERRRAGEGK